MKPFFALLMAAAMLCFQKPLGELESGVGLFAGQQGDFTVTIVALLP